MWWLVAALELAFGAHGHDVKVRSTRGLRFVPLGTVNSTIRRRRQAAALQGASPWKATLVNVGASTLPGQQESRPGSFLVSIPSKTANVGSREESDVRG